ncbi:MAG: (Fe-S)-binding protein [Gammaproteobacteria bacterium]
MSLPESIHKQEIIDATDQCVMCGLCLPHCPTYKVAKKESESPRGRIALVRALYEEQLEVSKSIHTHLDHCLTCMSCVNACPANVDYEKIIDAGRAVTHHQQNLWARMQKRFLLFSLSNTNTRKTLKACISMLRTMGILRLLANFRLPSLLPNCGKTDQFDSQTKQTSNPDTIRVAIVNSCAGDLTNDQATSSAMKILSKLGCDVVPQAQTLCCGALHQHSGDLNAAQKLRKQFLTSFYKQNLDYLLSLATGCGAQLKRYPLLDDTPSAHEIANKIVDVNEFLLQQIVADKLELKPLAKKVYLHKPCSQSQVTKDKVIIEKLLNLIPDIEVIEFEDNLICCGAGGVNTLSHDQLAQKLIANKMLELKNNPAAYLVSSNIGCALHFQAQIKQEDIDIQVCHPITLLAQQVL